MGARLLLTWEGELRWGVGDTAKEPPRADADGAIRALRAALPIVRHVSRGGGKRAQAAREAVQLIRAALPPDAIAPPDVHAAMVRMATIRLRSGVAAQIVREGLAEEARRYGVPAPSAKVRATRAVKSALQELGIIPTIASRGGDERLQFGAVRITEEVIFEPIDLGEGER